VNEYHKTSQEINKEYEDVRASQSDHRMFSVLYERYYEQIFVFIWRRTGDEDLTADICQQAFLKAMMNIGKFTFRGLPFSAWLYRIALNEMNMHFRKTKREREISIEETDASRLATEMGEDDNEERLALLLNNITKLLPEESQLLELRFFEKRSFGEIGVILAITENNAKVRTYRVIDKLKNLMKV